MGKSIPDRGAVAVEDFIDVVWNGAFEAIHLLEHQFQSAALIITLLEPDLKRHVPGHCCLELARSAGQHVRSCNIACIVNDGVVSLQSLCPLKRATGPASHCSATCSFQRSK